MKFFRIIIKGVSYFYYLLRFRDSRLAFLLAHYRINFQAANRIVRDGKYLMFIETGNKIRLESAYPYKDEMRSLISVLNNKTVKIHSDDPEKGIVLNVNDILLSVHSVFNIYTVFE